MKTQITWWANIYVGSYCKDTSTEVGPRALKDICQEYCDEVGFCVTFTTTQFFYTEGNEPGAIIGCINYPRFPRPNEENRERAIELAKRLMKAANQYRVSIVMPDETVMLEKEVDL